MQMSKIIIGTLRPPLATNATAGIIKGGDDITIGSGGEPVVDVYKRQGVGGLVPKLYFEISSFAVHSSQFAIFII